MSMVAPYGARGRRANVVLLAALLFFGMAPLAQARTVRILILGDSLAAGYGLPAHEGFQAVMLAALRARGHDAELQLVGGRRGRRGRLHVAGPIGPRRDLGGVHGGPRIFPGSGGDRWVR